MGDALFYSGRRVQLYHPQVRQALLTHYIFVDNDNYIFLNICLASTPLYWAARVRKTTSTIPYERKIRNTFMTDAVA